MKKRVQLITISTLSFLALLSIVFSSCEKQEQNFGPTTFYKPCQNVICLNGGQCRDGQCACAIGFEGAKCETRAIDKFVDNYTAFDDCFKDAKESYTCSVSSDFTPINELTLKGIGTLCTNDIKAFITLEKSNFDVPFQKTCQDLWVSGEGNLYNNVLSINLSFRDSVLHTTRNCSILLTRQ